MITNEVDISGFWKGKHFICGNPAHEEGQELVPREMSLEEEKAREKKVYLHGVPDKAFFACPKYNPNARKDDEKACFCHISVAEATKAIGIISSKVAQDEDELGACFLKNFSFHTKVASYKVIEAKENNGYLKILVYNDPHMVFPKGMANKRHSELEEAIIAASGQSKDASPKKRGRPRKIAVQTAEERPE